MMDSKHYEPMRGPGWMVKFELPDIDFAKSQEEVKPAETNIDKEIKKKVKKLFKKK